MRTVLALALAIIALGCDSNTGDGADPLPDDDAGASRADAAVVPLTCSGLDAQPLDSQWTVRSENRDRVAEVHVPASYDPNTPTPVVLNFHGLSSNPGQQALFSEMNDKSDSAGFIAVHARGIGSSWNAGACCGTAAAQGVDDVGFVDDLLDELERRLCVDPRRVFSTGLSNGGFLSYRLACESADRIAAIAPVAAVLGVDSCAPSRPVPVLHFHGTSDTLVPYSGGGLTGYPSVADTIAGWTERNQCDPPTVTYDEGDTLCETASSCAGGADVTLCTVDGGGHTWPGGVPIPGLGKTTEDIVATDAMWEFFSAHPR